jgi:sugar phosphate isomerase/epimerase
MTLIPVSIQLYTVRDQVAADLAGELRRISEIGYRGVETGELYGLKPSEFLSMLNDVGLKLSAAWQPTPTAESISASIDTFGRFGIEHFVWTCSPDDVATLDACKRTAEGFQNAAVVAKANGFKFAFHNHWWEFKRLPDGQMPYDILMTEAPDACAEFDTYWAQFAGTDAVDVVRRFQSRMELIHVKDGVMAEDHSMTAVGKGKMDMSAILGALDPAVTKWLIVELDSCHTDLDEAVSDSYTYLVESGFGVGNK